MNWGRREKSTSGQFVCVDDRVEFIYASITAENRGK
jgi:hypothetical protein